MQILIVDDEKELADFLCSSFSLEGIKADTAYDGESGLKAAISKSYDFIILDNVMPKMEGKEVCRELRNRNIFTPILMLSVQSEVDTKIEMLDVGVDDYLTKPFSFAELLARVKAISRRYADLKGECLKIGEVSVNIFTHEVKRGDEKIYLTAKEYQILTCLMKNKSKAVPRGQIMKNVWDENADIFSNALEAHITNLRRKIDRESDEKSCIETIIGWGYKME